MCNLNSKQMKREQNRNCLIGTEDTVVIARGKGNRELLEMVEKNHKIPPPMQDEARFPCSASRAISSSLSQLERRLVFLYATPEDTRDTRRNSRETLSFPPQLERASCSIPHLKMRANSPALTREESQLSPQSSKGSLSHLLQLERNPKIPATS